MPNDVGTSTKAIALMAKTAASCTWLQMDSAHARPLKHEAVPQPEAATAPPHVGDLAPKAPAKVAAKAKVHVPAPSPALFPEAAVDHIHLDVTPAVAARLAEATHHDAHVT